MMKRKLKIYIDTSVIGGCLDSEFKEASKTLLEQIRRGNIVAVISEITQLELKRAPRLVQDIVKGIPKDHISEVELSEEAVSLAREYISHGVLGKAKLVDAQHIAIATINKVDLVVSWNFKHIVNVNKIRGFNAVNLRMGYSMIDIRSPLEVIHDS